MKKTLLIGGLLGLLFGFLAWLITFLLEDSYLSRDAWMLQHEDTLYYIEETLADAYPTDDTSTLLDVITALEQKENASIDLVMPLSLATSDDAMANKPERMIYYDVTINDSLVLNVGLDHDDQPLIPVADWLQLALISIAILCAVWVTALLGNHRLRLLEDTVLETSSGKTHDPQNDPITTAIDALQAARDEITQLQQARQSAIEDHRDLLASVAHEFRNPLARLQFANEMAMERSGDEQQALFNEANLAANELDALVRETLHYSRLRSLDNVLEREPVSVVELLQEMSDQPLSLPDNVRFLVTEPDNNALITVDRRLMIRAVTNLVSNAARYAAETITLSAEMDTHAVKLSVIDDGPGIDATHATRIFEPFYRVGASRSRESGGFGLGLSIVKSICEQHQATVELIPSTRGCHFQITLSRESDTSQSA